MPDRETYENLVATFVDVVSIMFAYSIGLRQLNLELGLLYAIFDAWIVIWMRKPIARGLRKLFAPGLREKSNVFLYQEN